MNIQIDPPKWYHPFMSATSTRQYSLKNTITLLRFPFSLFLLPVSLFSLYYIQPSFSIDLVLVMLIWHVLVFPSSNGYNSFHDRDTGPVGGLSSPPLPDRSLLYTCNLFDALAIILSCTINIQFALLVAGYIFASRLYSNRSIRLKKYPIIGFMVVFIFQGMWVFYANITALSVNELSVISPALYAALACSFFIGALFPITQIYQHEDDSFDQVRSMSMLLGKRSTFIFTALMFTFATAFIYMFFKENNTIENFHLYTVFMFPSILFFIIWAVYSFRNPVHIHFLNTMIMLILSSMLINLYFIIIIFN